MKTKTAIAFILFLIAQQIQAQTYQTLNFVLNPNTDSEVTYVYPEDTDFVITDAEGNTTSDLDGNTAIYEGVVLVKLNTKWNTEPDQLRAESGLSVSMQEHAIENSGSDQEDKSQHAYGAYTGDIEVTYKELLEEAQGYGVRMGFSNGITFKLENSQAEAFQGEQPLPIEGKYRISSPEGKLYISFDADTAESWYFFEPKN